MIIHKRKADGRTVYAVCSDLREVGGSEPQEIIILEDLETAALVLRYLRGDRTSIMDQEDAKAAIRAAEGRRL